MVRAREQNGQERVRISQGATSSVGQQSSTSVLSPTILQFISRGFLGIAEAHQKSPHYKEQVCVIATSCALLYLQGKSTMGRGRWSPYEDGKLYEYIERNGGEPSSWKNVPRDAGLSWRDSKSCKLRWNTELWKDINKNPLSEEEKATIIRFQKQHGNKWEEIARLLQGRTATKIKNF